MELNEEGSGNPKQAKNRGPVGVRGHRVEIKHGECGTVDGNLARQILMKHHIKNCAKKSMKLKLQVKQENYV